MATQAKEAIATHELTIVADRGYFNGEEIKTCEDAGYKTYLPKCQTSGNQAQGLFGKRNFIYQIEVDEYTCPTNEHLIYRCSSQEKGKTIHRYWSSACPNCEIKPQCTKGKNRRVSRWEHEAVLDKVNARIEHERMKARRETVEHPYGTIKHWMGYTHFQMRTLELVSAEMSLHVLAYNMKCVMNIIGITTLTEAMQA